MTSRETERDLVPEQRNRLSVLESSGRLNDIDRVVQSLREDSVVLVRNLELQHADAIIRHVASAFGLLDRLDMQATFADMLGHRHRVGKYRMSVNMRPSHQFIPPHSEGDSFTGIQLASFYCCENSTDGGVTVLLNVDDSSPTWTSLRERVMRLDRGSRHLESGELRRATVLHHLHTPATVRVEDRVLGELQSAIPGVKLVDALAVPRKIRSVILERDLYSYWDSIASVDRSAVGAYARLIRNSGLLKEPVGHDLSQLDNAAPRRIWASGVDHASLFRCRITHKLVRGDLVVLNNFTWAHSVTNWTAESGVRDVSAAFA